MDHGDHLVHGCLASVRALSPTVSVEYSPARSRAQAGEPDGDAGGIPDEPSSPATYELEGLLETHARGLHPSIGNAASLEAVADTSGGLVSLLERRSRLVGELHDRESQQRQACTNEEPKALTPQGCLITWTVHM